ncbi:MAG: NAD-dependent epimerase/dehydratase family protein [candidate division Zixibacteria bacterium]|jgi:UDP-glucose 4-epimerase|nr:NAD-dependent epimerase/dehydratase family protein [candidate division Zixibacteria bacterium]
MKALVTGGAGFIGSQVADALIENGHHVEIIDNLFTGRRENLPAKAVFHHLDIRSDEIHDVFARGGFDVMFHLAAQMDVRKSVADPAYDAQANILGGINLLQACKNTGVKKVIFSSTGGAIYGEQVEFPAKENHPQNPCSPYGISKLAFEKYLQFYYSEYGLKYISLRYANVYGPRQRGDGEAGVVAIFFERLLAGQKAVIYGDGEQTRDFTFVGDVVKANLAALEYSDIGAFNVGTGIETNINELFDIIKEIVGSKQGRIHEPGKPGEQRRSVIDHTKINNAMGWKPQFTLRQGLLKTAEYFRKL